MNAEPKISIITVVYNAEALIEKTILSVIHQTFSNIEFLIIDGASTDNTLAIIKKHEKHITKFVSEKDKGIYDAMNKGLRLASGEYVLFLNAGDELYDNSTLQSIFSENKKADIYYGNTAVIDSTGHIIADRRLSPPESLNWKSLKYGMCVSHQSFIAKRLLCDFYDTNYSVAADIDWVINTLKQADVIINTHLYVSKFLEGGTSNKRRKKALKERFSIMKKHYGIIQTLWSHFYILLRFPFHKLFKKGMT